MEVGCGLEVKRIKGRRYLYFWSYKRTNGKSKRAWKYLGPVGRTETTKKALEALAGHYAIVRAEADRRLMSAKGSLVRLQS